MSSPPHLRLVTPTPEETIQSLASGDPTLLEQAADIASRLLSIPYSPESPTPKQAQFLLDFSKEALYGGAAGGGKSSALLMAALQFVDVPGYAALILRKSFADLAMPGAIMERADEWLRGTDAKWSENTHTWTFPSGATLTFGYIQTENDRLKYQGAEFHFVGFDEVTQFKERDYRYLFSRVRRPKDQNLAISRVPLRVRAATNPGGPGHNWVYHRFVAAFEEREKRAEMLRQALSRAEVLVNGQPVLDPAAIDRVVEQWKKTKPVKRAFYPAMLEDNPHLDTSEYDSALSELDAVTKAQLRSGNWNIKPQGRVFARSDFLIVDSPPDSMHFVRYWDLAATEKNPHNDPDWTAGCLLGRDPSNGLYYILDMVHFRKDPYDTEQAILAQAQADRAIWGHVQIRMEQEPGASGKSVISQYARLLSRFEFYGHLPSGPKIERAKIVAAKVKPKLVRVVKGGWVEEFLDEIEQFPDGEHDDQVDALSGAYDRLAAMSEDGGVAIADGSMTQTNEWASGWSAM